MIDGKQVTRSSSFIYTNNERLDYLIRTEYECYVSCVRKFDKRYDFRWLLGFEECKDIINAFIDVERQHIKVMELLTDKQKKYMSFIIYMDMNSMK